MSTSPVFVDDSGRRARWLRGACWALASTLLGYVLLVVAALVAPSDVLSLRIPGLGPVLPGSGAPALVTQDGRRSGPAQVVATLPTPRPKPSPSRGASATAPRAQPSARPTALPTTAATGRPTSAPSARPSATGAPTAKPTKATGRPTDKPTPPRATPTRGGRP